MLVFPPGPARSGALIWLSIGVVIALLAWTPILPLPLMFMLLALPAAWAAAPDRASAITLYLGYELCASRDIPALMQAYFPASSTTSCVILWVFLCLLVTLPWALLWRSTMSAISAGVLACLAIIAVSVPPLGFIGGFTPLALAGVAFPGFGFVGIFLALVMLTLAATTFRIKRIALGLPIMLLGLLSVVAMFNYQRPLPPSGWRAIDTHLGAYQGANTTAGRLPWQASLVASVTQEFTVPGTRLLILPEGIADWWEPDVSNAWQSLDVVAKAQGITVLVGAEKRLSPERFANGLFGIGRDQHLETHARVPMPLALWHPGIFPTATTDPLLDNTITLDGKRVGLSFCYEDFLGWLHALTMLHGRPDVLVSVANNWFSTGLSEPAIQARHIQLWADLWGIPLLRAVNWAKETR